MFNLSSGVKWSFDRKIGKSEFSTMFFLSSFANSYIIFPRIEVERKIICEFLYIATLIVFNIFYTSPEFTLIFNKNREFKNALFYS
jgi:hypothetical protein